MAMALTTEPDVISAEAYIEGELISEIKHEYVDGQLFAMTGGTPNHVRISGDFFRKIQDFLAGLTGKPCEAFQSDMKVRTPEGNYRYPDVVVICVDVEESYTDSPVILVEVISKSTRRMDTVVKKREYLTIPTLKEYVLIEQDFVDVEVFRQENDWRSDHYFLGDEVYLASIGCTISVAEIYERVTNEDMLKFKFLQEKTEEAGKNAVV